jgi:hypothetical protein
MKAYIIYKGDYYLEMDVPLKNELENKFKNEKEREKIRLKIMKFYTNLLKSNIPGNQIDSVRFEDEEELSEAGEDLSISDLDEGKGVEEINFGGVETPEMNVSKNAKIENKIIIKNKNIVELAIGQLFTFPKISAFIAGICGCGKSI